MSGPGDRERLRNIDRLRPRPRLRPRLGDLAFVEDALPAGTLAAIDSANLPSAFEGRSRVLLLNADTEETQKSTTASARPSHRRTDRAGRESARRRFSRGVVVVPCDMPTAHPTRTSTRLWRFCAASRSTRTRRFRRWSARATSLKRKTTRICYQQKAFGVPNWIPRDKVEKSQFHIHARFVNDFFDNITHGAAAELEREREAVWVRGNQLNATAASTFHAATVRP